LKKNKTVVFVKNADIFAKVFGQNILKIKTPVPWKTEKPSPTLKTKASLQKPFLKETI
jgi:hypothetical protein